MTATNHAVTGALLAVVLPAQLVLPLALLSHFVLDALPHYDYGGSPHTSRSFKIRLALDTGLMLTATAVAVLLFSHIWWLILLGAAAAVSPDLMWLPHFLADHSGHPKKFGPIARFHKKIQWAELPAGWISELIYLSLIIFLLLSVS